MKLGIIYTILGYSPACLRNQGTLILTNISFQTGKRETFSPRASQNCICLLRSEKEEQRITIATVPEMAFLIARESGYNAKRKASEIVMAYEII